MNLRGWVDLRGAIQYVFIVLICDVFHACGRKTNND